MDSPRSRDQPDALAEGRRIYLGNLTYSVQPAEIEDMLKENGFTEYEKIHISMDPVSGRNPGYCFVDFSDRGDAERALSSLDTSIRSRPLKVGPCEPKKQQKSRWRSDRETTFNRWGDWSGKKGGDDSGVPIESADKRGIEQGPYGAIKHFEEAVATDRDGRRLYVGGLGKMIDQEQNQDEMREIFADFKPITPRQPTRDAPGNYHYCFVDFATVEEASAAREALNGKAWKGEPLRVNVANPLPAKLLDRTNPAKEDGSPSGDNTARGEQSPAGERSTWRKANAGSPASKSNQPLKSLASSNWRQRDLAPVSGGTRT
ncbi:Polyadenylate-binding protein, cytoplasmic and nuclear 1 [Colletotrichum chlorophyti]|uniref:Polyadenylate-binding protein, cytoplasmic and nuclear 1 n=1 Tax=Colletotrichum chlorophyti TaxID=708187 RepID=A0A1Q8S931_9PEZI|nr:Polyadenylate-binding protein, cytoplasmic and nuclear 1 [Colletotrichum chlorophyti]